MKNIEQIAQNASPLTGKDFMELAKSYAPIVVGLATTTGIGYVVGGNRGALIGVVCGLVAMSNYYPIEEIRDSCDEAE